MEPKGCKKFEIYSTMSESGSGLVPVSDELRLQILSHLEVKPLSTTEISEATGKAQSTLSVHLENMVSDGLIRSRYDPNDSRRKIFSLAADKIAYSTEADGKGMEVTRTLVRDAMRDPGVFYKNMLSALVTGIESAGLNIGPALKSLGSTLGLNLAATMSYSKVEDIVRVLQEYYSKNGMGEVSIYTFLPLTIIVKKDESGTVFQTASFAAFTHGLFETVLSVLIGRNYKVTTFELFGNENGFHKFVIELAK